MTKQAQQWLDTKYNNKQSGDSIKLLTSEELSGEIKIENYANTKEIILVRLEKGSLSKGKISKVTIRNCQEVERVLLGRNEITEIVFDGDFPKLTHLGARDNQLSKIDLSKVSNLEILNIAGNPIGSQEIEKAIKGLTKLKFVNTPGFSLKNIADDHADWINPDDIKNALGVKPTDPLPDD
jgi:Leucine-rich repeat (LRR) protein